MEETVKMVPLQRMGHQSLLQHVGIALGRPGKDAGAFCTVGGRYGDRAGEMKPIAVGAGAKGKKDMNGGTGDQGKDKGCLRHIGDMAKDADRDAPVLPSAPAAASATAQAQDRTQLILLAQTLGQLPAAQLAQQSSLLRSTSNGLQTVVAQTPKDAAAWQALSGVLRVQGQPLRAIRAEAEARAAQYDYTAAVDRLRAGQDMARHSKERNDYYEASIIDTRLREMQELAKEQAARK